jgi:hypothetical protein
VLGSSLVKFGLKKIRNLNKTNFNNKGAGLHIINWSPSSEANSFSAGQEIARVLWKPKIHYCIRKTPLPPAAVLSQKNPIHFPVF